MPWQIEALLQFLLIFGCLCGGLIILAITTTFISLYLIEHNTLDKLIKKLPKWIQRILQ